MVELLIVILMSATIENTNAKLLTPELFETYKQCREVRAERMKEYIGQNVIMSCRYKN